MRYGPEWSADGKKIAFSDKDGRLWVLNVTDRKLAEVAHSTEGPILDYQWSPRAEFLAYSTNNPNGFSSVYIWSGKDGRRLG